MRNIYTMLLASVVTAAYADEAGSRAFESCAACHSLKIDNNENLGPSLYQLIGRKAGTVEGFSYSGPMKRSGITWDKDSLSKFLRNPQLAIPGNRMPFSGITDEAELAALIDYLMTATKGS